MFDSGSGDHTNSASLSDYIYQCSHGQVRWPPPPLISGTVEDEQDDKTLVKAIKTGCEVKSKKAFAALYSRYYEEIWKYVRKRVQCDDQAKDLFGAVWEVAVSDLPSDKFKWQGKPVIAWLKGVAKMKCQEIGRNNHKNSSSSLEALYHALGNELKPRKDSPLLEKFTENETAALLLEAAHKLKSQKQQKIIKLYYFAGLPLKAIAKKLDVSYDSVRQEHRRALKAMKIILEEMGVSHV